MRVSVRVEACWRFGSLTNAVRIARAVRERQLEGKLVFIGHEATEGTKELLLKGVMDAVIDQNPRVEAREALGILSHAVKGLPYEPHPPRLQVIFKENIPEI